MAKRRIGRYPKAFKQMAVERLIQCENIVALSHELGVSRRLLYTWCEKLEPVNSGDGPPATSRELTLRHEASRLKRALAETVLEVDFFKGALHTVEARRQRSGQAGAQASTAHIRDVMSRQGPLSIERMYHLAQVRRFFKSRARSPKLLVPA